MNGRCTVFIETDWIGPETFWVIKPHLTTKQIQGEKIKIDWEEKANQKINIDTLYIVQQCGMLVHIVQCLVRNCFFVYPYRLFVMNTMLMGERFYSLGWDFSLLPGHVILKDQQNR